jgi:glycolate oxidase subunit GlcD
VNCRISTEAVSELKERIDQGSIYLERERLEAHASDESKLVYMPDLVVEPTSPEEIQEVMAWATRHRIPVTPRAAASNVVGGALAVKGGVILSLMKMNRIIDIDPQNLIAVVEPGVITIDLQSAVETKGLYYPPDPASIDTSTIGGNVAEDAGGPHCLKYGTTKDYVLGLTVVLPDGRLFQTGGTTRKGVVGYDLTHLWVGSEGTLGVITRIILRLIPKPRSVATLLVPFRDVESAMETVARILRQGIVPAAIELLRMKFPSMSSETLPFAIPEGTQALLLIEIDGHPLTIEAGRDEIGDICLEEKALDVLVVEGTSKRQTLWENRRKAWSKLVEEMALVETLDPVIPLDSISRYVREVGKIEERHGVSILCAGHAGDGNIHTNLISEIDTPEIREKMKQAAGDIMSLALSMGGTIAGEHGIGFTKREYASMQLSETSMTLQRGIKRLVDPLNIMNPEKIFA